MRVAFIISQEQKKSCTYLLTSRLNRTPPIGEPNAADIPAAAAAERISLLRAT